jgi:exodeoxyribonuclease V alpha subunit
MVLKNDYNREVFNGDQGKIIALSTEEKDKHIVVEFMDSDGTAFDTKYTLDELRGEKSITLSYATTVHKSQGSEYKVVILVILSSHHLLLKRNLFYTGITRARDRLDLVYDKRAANTAARTEDSLKRNSLLKERVVANYDARNCGNEVGKLPKPQGHIDQVQSGIEHSDGGEQQWEDQPF